MPIHNLVFEGSGIKGTAYVGALHALSNKVDFVRDIRRVAGASAGAIVATLLTVGYAS